MKTWQSTLTEAGFPTTALVLDVESYYDSDYHLGKDKAALSIVEYVTDSRFELHGFGFQVLNHKWENLGPRFVPQPKIVGAMNKLTKQFGKCLHNVTVVMANAKFDALILALKFGLYPPFVIDVEDLVRYYDAKLKTKLAKAAPFFGFKAKGDTSQFKGQHFAEIDLQAMTEYAVNDVELEAALFKHLLPIIDNPKFELALMRHTLGLYIRPKIRYDYALADKLIAGMQEQITLAVKDVAPWIMRTAGFSEQDIADADDCWLEVVTPYLSGDLTFARLLRAALPKDESLPTKPGKPTRNMIPITGEGRILALAKNDDGGKALLIHKDATVRALATAHLAINSWPGHINRVEKMKRQATASGGLLRVPLKYYGTHTGRWSGEHGINLGNLGGAGRGKAINKLISQVRHTMIAPEGCTFVLCDAPQIEARDLAYHAGQQDLIDGFRNGEDIYSEFATDLFQEKVWKPSDEEEKTSEGKRAGILRGFGKDAILGCFAAGTPILTNTGWKLIETLVLQDRVWDGIEFVNHSGIICRGEKKCINQQGVWLTPEHEILTSDGWIIAAALNISSQMSGVHTGNSPLRPLNADPAVGLSPSNVVARVGEELLQVGTIWSQENLHAAMSVLKPSLVGLSRLFPMFLEPQAINVWLPVFVQLWTDVAIRKIEIGTDTADVEYVYGQCGYGIRQHLSSILCRCLDMMMPISKLIVSTIIEDTSRVISASLQGLYNAGIQNAICYDILNCGSRRRFQAGSLLGGNCGYGMGADRFYERCLQNDTLRPLFDSGEYDYAFVRRLIDTYRMKYDRIPAFWSAVERAWRIATKYRRLEKVGRLAFWHKDGTTFLTLPSGRTLRYRHARIDADDRCHYIGGEHEHISLWGGSITENIIQSDCRDYLGLWILEADPIYPVVHHVYDEIVCLVFLEQAEQAKEQTSEMMGCGPAWADGMPFGKGDASISPYYKK